MMASRRSPRRRRRGAYASGVGRANRGKLRCALMFIAAAGLLASTRLSQLWTIFDIASHFTLHFGIVAAAFLIGYFMPRARVFTGLVLSLAGFIAIGLYAHVAERPAADHRGAPAGRNGNCAS